MGEKSNEDRPDYSSLFRPGYIAPSEAEQQAMIQDALYTNAIKDRYKKGARIMQAHPDGGDRSAVVVEDLKVNSQSHSYEVRVRFDGETADRTLYVPLSR